MHRNSLALLIGALLAGALCLVSCKRAQDPPKSAAPEPAVRTDSVRPAVPPAQPARDYASDQAEKRRVTEREIAALGAPARRDPERVREILLRRKGEVLMMQRDVRADAGLSDAERDSLLRALESESIEISKRLLAVSGARPSTGSNQ